VISLRSPLYVKGTFKNPRVGVNAGALAVRGAAVVGLGLDQSARGAASADCAEQQQAASLHADARRHARRAECAAGGASSSAPKGRDLYGRRGQRVRLRVPVRATPRAGRQQGRLRLRSGARQRGAVSGRLRLARGALFAPAAISAFRSRPQRIWAQLIDRALNKDV